MIKLEKCPHCGSDVILCKWFWETTKIPVGRGKTPREAVEDLKRRLEALKDAGD